MIKKSTYFVLGTALTLLASCKEGDPKKVYNLPDEPEITGTRILKTVKNGDHNTEEYNSSFGTLYSVKRNDIENGNITKSQNITINYLNGNISKLVVSGTFEGINSIGRAEIIPQYEATTGRINSITNNVFEGVTQTYREVSTIEYDTNGKVISVQKVYSTPITIAGNVVFQNSKKIYENLNYTGNNITSVEKIIQNISNAGIITSTEKTTTTFPQYDWRPNAYNTISAQYLLLMANLIPDYYYSLSENNPTQKVVTTPNGTQTKTNYSYTYDRQGYPVSNGILKYTYQAIP